MNEEEFLHFENEGYIYTLFDQYQKDHKSVPIEWVRFFQGMELTTPVKTNNQQGECLDVQRVIDYFKKYGHLFAKTNSLQAQKPFNLDQMLEYTQLSKADLLQLVSAKDYKEKNIPLAELIEILKQNYCGGFGLEFFQEDQPEKAMFFQNAMNHKESIPTVTLVSALKEVGKAKLLEEFLHKKFLGAKRFSIEGGESFLSLLKIMVDEAAAFGYQEGYIGMAHRGRVNTLCHIMEKPYHEIFTEFKSDQFPQKPGLGDVKYHSGYKNTVKTLSGKSIFLQMAANPSHLEAVNAVLAGMIRARLDEGLPKALGVVIHGDASIAGQGIVYETLQFDSIEGYTNKGTIHVIIDNQIGFTASPKQSRSTYYPSDIAKAFSIPVLHVDATRIEDVIAVAKIAVQYQDKFKSDIFIHFSCHRLYGHNEADEPNFTNPGLYEQIKGCKDLYSTLKGDFLEKNWITQGEIDSFELKLKEQFKLGFEKITPGGEKPLEDLVSFTTNPEEEYEAYPKIETKISRQVFEQVKQALTTTPKDFNLHPKIQKLIQGRGQALEMERENLIDWAIAELMAYGSILIDGRTVRLSGQDSCRGTFSHRHAVYVDQLDEDRVYNPLDHIKKNAFTVYNSPLSEYAVMGFEYGYSINTKNGLVIWEAQFGDFYNGASIVVDQFITATKSKWGITSSLVLYLPNGNEGMGQEHTSGRIERFLQLAARKNLRIFYPTTPKQMFHLIRSQALSEDKVPLIVFTPKKDLRNQTSSAAEFKEGELEQVIVVGSGQEEKIVFASGKIALEIEKADKEKSCAIVRIEQLYPFPQEKIREVLKKFTNAKTFIYAQEEPKNQGAYSFAKEYLNQIIGKKGTLQYVGRIRLESTATAFSSVFKYEQEIILKKVLE